MWLRTRARARAHSLPFYNRASVHIFITRALPSPAAPSTVVYGWRRRAYLRSHSPIALSNTRRPCRRRWVCVCVCIVWQCAVARPMLLLPLALRPSRPLLAFTCTFFQLKCAILSFPLVQVLSICLSRFVDPMALGSDRKPITLSPSDW